MKVFFSTQNIDPGLFGQKEGLHLSIPTGLGIARIATSGRGVGAGGIHKISSLVPRVKSKKESGAVLGRGCLYVASSVQGKAWPFHPRGWLCQVILGLWHACALCSARSGSLVLPLLWPAPQLEAR